MKLLIAIFLISLFSCSTTSFFAEEERPIAIHSDSYKDIYERYGEPEDSYIRLNGSKVIILAKYYDVYGYEVVYMHFEHIEKKEFHFYDRSTLTYQRNMEKSFTNYPENWIVTKLDFRPNQENNDGEWNKNILLGAFGILASIVFML